MGLNKVEIMGNVGNSPAESLRYLSSGTAVCNLRVATTERWVKDGVKQERTEWHRVSLFSKNAENAAKFLTVGRSVFITGRLQTRMWEKDGQKHYSTEIIAQNIQFLGTRPQTEENLPVDNVPGDVQDSVDMEVPL
jgi:single-strand DNA-binding protein